jgi:LysM domain
MLDKVKVLICLLALSPLAWGDEVKVNPDHPDKYTVVKGDTLWDISGRFLTQPWRWPEIWKANPQIQNPHLIYPGDVISLSYEGGSPVLNVERGESSAQSMGGRDVKLSPKVRVSDEGKAIHSIPIDAIRNFLKQPLVVGEHDMDAWPYVVSSYQKRLLAGPGNQIYVRGLTQGGTEHYSIYRKGNAYRRGGTEDGELLGYEALYVGDADVLQYGDPATAIVTTAVREVLEGDRLVAQSKDEITSDFIPKPAAQNVGGSIISVVDGLSQIGQYQVVVMDVGASSGLEVGNVMGVYQRGATVSDRINTKAVHPFIEYLGKPHATGTPVILPDEYAGVIMVFRTFPNVSYGLVMEAIAPVHIEDHVKAM